MKKIVFLADNWFGDKGGRKKVVLALINNLISDYKISLITIDTKISPEKINDFQEFLNEKVKIIPYFFPRKNNLVFIIRLFLVFGKELRKEKPDLVICAGGGPHSNAIFALITKVSTKAKIISLEQGNPIEILKRQNELTKLITKIGYKKIDLLISASRELAEYVGKLFSLKKEKIDYVYNFVNPETIKKMSEEKVEEDVFYTNQSIVLTAARLDLYQKDYPTLLKAFKEVSKNEDVCLVIIGTGSDEDKIKKLAEDLKIAHKVFFLGYKLNPYKYMKNANVFVLSSFHEGLPLVLVEAMICGVPVISSDCNFGPREIIQNGENGFLFPVGDYKKLAELISLLINNKQLKEKIVNNAYKTAEYFSEEKAISKYKQLIGEILKNY